MERGQYFKVRKKAPVFHISQQSLFDMQTFGLFLALLKRDTSQIKLCVAIVGYSAFFYQLSKIKVEKANILTRICAKVMRKILLVFVATNCHKIPIKKAPPTNAPIPP